MLFKFKTTITRKTFLYISIPIVLITLAALLLLSYLINQNSKKTYEDIAEKSFYKRFDALEREFLRIAQHQNLLDTLVRTSTTTALAPKFNLLNQINHSTKLLQEDWFYSKEQSNLKKVTPSELLPILTEQQNLQSHASTQTQVAWIESQDSLYWFTYKTIAKERMPALIYGSTINLQKLYEYLIYVDVSTPNYAYIFDKEGRCIFHPDIQKIGQSVFDFTSLQPNDTLIKKGYTNPPNSISEYLKIDVIRFLKPIKTANFEGYICINFPKINADESIDEVKKYTFLIFLTTVFLVLFIFYIFNSANRRAYEEKRILAVENEKFSKEKALVQLQQLKNQINPHFLFNSLNSLYMLIDLNRNDAKKFTLNLSKIYRYLINPPPENLVTLEQELLFIKEYISLQQSRFLQEIIFETSEAPPESLPKKLPYLALQIAIENALKHNIATVEQPLLIQIHISGQTVMVINNLQKKNNVPNNEQFGLKYLDGIYRFYLCEDFGIELKDGYFICSLPLIP